jgi:hypothetical protein
MKKYIFTESQIKKIIDSQITESKDLQEQTMGSAVTTNTLPQMEYVFFQDPSLIEKIKKQGVFKVIRFENTGKGIKLNGTPIKEGQIINVNTKISIPMSSSIIVSGMGIKGNPPARISFGIDRLQFEGSVQ